MVGSWGSFTPTWSSNSFCTVTLNFDLVFKLLVCYCNFRMSNVGFPNLFYASELEIYTYPDIVSVLLNSELFLTNLYYSSSVVLTYSISLKFQVLRIVSQSQQSKPGNSDDFCLHTILAQDGSRVKRLTWNKENQKTEDWGLRIEKTENWGLRIENWGITPYHQATTTTTTKGG